MNIASEKATVCAVSELSDEELARTVEKAGYRLVEVPDRKTAAEEPRGPTVAAVRLVVAAALSVPLMIIAMTPILSGVLGGWIQAVLAGVITFGAGWP